MYFTRSIYRHMRWWKHMPNTVTGRYEKIASTTPEINSDYDRALHSIPLRKISVRLYAASSFQMSNTNEISTRVSFIDVPPKKRVNKMKNIFGTRKINSDYDQRWRPIPLHKISRRLYATSSFQVSNENEISPRIWFILLRHGSV